MWFPEPSTFVEHQAPCLSSSKLQHLGPGQVLPRHLNGKIHFSPALGPSVGLHSWEAVTNMCNFFFQKMNTIRKQHWRRRKRSEVRFEFTCVSGWNRILLLPLLPFFSRGRRRAPQRLRLKYRFVKIKYSLNTNDVLPRTGKEDIFRQQVKYRWTRRFKFPGGISQVGQIVPEGYGYGTCYQNVVITWGCFEE